MTFAGYSLGGMTAENLLNYDYSNPNDGDCQVFSAAWSSRSRYFALASNENNSVQIQV